MDRELRIKIAIKIRLKVRMKRGVRFSETFFRLGACSQKGTGHVPNSINPHHYDFLNCSL